MNDSLWAIINNKGGAWFWLWFWSADLKMLFLIGCVSAWLPNCSAQVSLLTPPRWGTDESSLSSAHVCHRSILKVMDGVLMLCLWSEQMSLKEPAVDSDAVLVPLFLSFATRTNKGPEWWKVTLQASVTRQMFLFFLSFHHLPVHPGVCCLTALSPNRRRFSAENFNLSSRNQGATLRNQHSWNHHCSIIPLHSWLILKVRSSF